MQKWVAAILATLLFGQAGLADPLHRFGNDGAYRHEGSGWIFPKQIGGLDRVRPPYTLDGNDDVRAEYATVQGGMRRTALVDVYYPDSAASGAKLPTARLSMQSNLQLKSEEPFLLPQLPGLTGVKATYISDAGADSSQSSLYFFQTPDWVVTICTTSRAADTQAAAALDEFVRALRWDTLGSDPGDLHGGAR